VRERLKRLPGGPMQPLTIHLRQELDRLNTILRLATTTLQNLRLAIAGTIALSGALIEALDALFMARIPEAWLKKSWEVRGVCVVACLVKGSDGGKADGPVCCVLPNPLSGLHTWQLVHWAAGAPRPAGQVAGAGAAARLLAHRLLQPPGERAQEQHAVLSPSWSDWV
jgi:hypothetical protein